MPFQDDNQSQDTSKNRVCLGKISSPHGVKGLVKILSFGEDAGLLDGPCYVSEDSDKVITVILKNPLGKYILAEIEGCNGREDAEALKGTELYIDRDTLPDIEDDDSFYIEDLKGLRVIENDVEIGKVKAAVNFGAGDLLDITLKSGQDILIPFTDDAVPDVNIQDGFVATQDHTRFIIE